MTFNFISPNLSPEQGCPIIFGPRNSCSFAHNLVHSPVLVLANMEFFHNIFISKLGFLPHIGEMWNVWPIKFGNIKAKDNLRRGSVCGRTIRKYITRNWVVLNLVLAWVRVSFWPRKLRSYKVFLYIYIYIYIYVCVCVYIYIYIYNF